MYSLARMRQAIANYLEYRAVEKHRSRLGRGAAPKYSAYLDMCQKAFKGTFSTDETIQRAVSEFHRQGFATLWSSESRQVADCVMARIREEENAGLDIWDQDLRYKREVYRTFPEVESLFRGLLGSFLQAVYRADFKIFYGVLFKSERRQPEPTGSELWHTDGGPGTCINVMFYLSDVEKEDGAMECLPWNTSLEIYKKELQALDILQQRIRALSRNGRILSSEEIRKVKCDFYLDEITKSYLDKVEQPVGKAGLILPFSNNLMHKGGYPEEVRKRYACVFHCYPSHKPTPYNRYREFGIKKTASYPLDPAAEF